MVLDGDLYLLDLDTGKDVFEPVLVGDSKKDTIMYVDYSGNVYKRH